MSLFTHRNPDMKIEKGITALVVADLQNEFFDSKQGSYYPMISENLKKYNVAENIEKLLETAQKLGYFIIHSPHYYYPTDKQWKINPGAMPSYLGEVGFVGRKDPLDLTDFEGSRADYYEPFKKYLMDGKTANTSPHKGYNTEANDVVKQLLFRRVQKVIMAGPVANLCLEGHMRDLIEAGMEIAVVRDAVSAGKNEEGDGYTAAMVNYRFIANAIWTTEEAIEHMEKEN